MAKRLLLSTLSDALGDYVEGLSSEDLKLGVWGGDVELSHLRIKASALSTLSVPLRVAHGVIHDFKVHVPWTSLQSKPVKVSIRGVYLVVTPMDPAEMGDQELKQQYLEKRQAEIEAALAAAAKAKQPSTPTETGWLANLKRTILDNIQVTVEDVHLRYENPTVLKEDGVLAVGVGLKGFTVRPADRRFHESFQERRLGDPVQQKIRLSSLSVYCDVGGASVLDPSLGPEGLEDRLRSGIMTLTGRPPPAEDPPGADEGKHMLAPTARDRDGLGPSIAPDPTLRPYVLLPLSAELCFSGAGAGAGEGHGPELSATQTGDLQVPEMNLHFSGRQFRALMRLKAEVDKVMLFYEMMPHRPEVRPTQDPRGWWKYAFRCVARKSGGGPDWQELLRNLHMRKRYMAMYAAIQQHNDSPAAKKGVAEPKQIQDFRRQLKGMDGVLPIPTIILYRKAAEAEVEARKVEQARGATASRGDAAGKGKKKSSFWGSMFRRSSSNDEEDDDDLSLEELDKEVSEAKETEAQDPQGLSLVGVIQAHMTLQVSGVDYAPILRIGAGITAAASVTHDGTMSVYAGLDEFYVENGLDPSLRRFAAVVQVVSPEDEEMASKVLMSGFARPPTERLSERTRPPVHVTTSAAMLRAILKGELHSAGNADEPCVEARLKQSPAGATNLRARCRAFHIGYDKGCVDVLLQSFQLSAKDVAAIQGLASTQIQRAQVAAQDVVQDETTSFTVSLEMPAPKIFVPTLSREGLLLLDAGSIQLDMSVRGGKTDLTLELLRTQVLLTVSAEDAQQAAEAAGSAPGGDIVVHPLDTTVKVRSGGDRRPDGDDTHVVVDAAPLRAEMQPRLLRKLLSAVAYASTKSEAAKAVEGDPALAPEEAVDFGPAGGAATQEAVLDLVSEAGDSEDGDAEDAGPLARTKAASATESVAPKPRAERLQLRVEVTLRGLTLQLYPNERRPDFTLQAVDASGGAPPARPNPLFTLFLDNLTVRMEDRIHDTHLHLAFHGMSLEDHALASLEGAQDNEGEPLQYLIESVTHQVYDAESKTWESGTDVLFALELMQFKSVEAPAYDGCAMDVGLRFQTLRLACAASSIRQLKPYTESLLSATDDASSASSPPPPASATAPAGEAESSTQQRLTEVQELQRSVLTDEVDPASMRVAVTLESISLRVLESDPLAPILAAEVAGLQLSMTKREDTALDLVLRTLHAFDVRPSTAHYAHKQLIGPSRGTPLARLDRQRSLRKTIDDPALQECAPLFRVNLRQRGTAVMEVDIHLDQLTLCVIVPLLLRSLDAILDIKDAAMFLLATGEAAEMPEPPDLASLGPQGSLFEEMEGFEELDEEADEASAPESAGAGPMGMRLQRQQEVGNLGETLPGGEADEASTAEAGPSSSSMVVQFFVQRPRLILLEDASKVQSLAVVAQCTTNAIYRSETTESSNIDDVHLSVADLRMFVERMHGVAEGPARAHDAQEQAETDKLRGPDDGPEIVNRILQPMAVDASARIEYDHGQAVSLITTLSASGAQMRLSYKDVVLFSSVLAGVGEAAAVERLQKDLRTSTPAATLAADSSPAAPPGGHFDEQASYRSGADSTQSFSLVQGSNVQVRRLALLDASLAEEDVTAEATEETFDEVPDNAMVVHATFDFRGIGLVLVNDVGGNSLPLLQLKVPMISGNAGGAMGALRASLDAGIGLDFWHPRLSLWEPVLEPYELTLRVKQYVRSTSAAVHTEQFLQINVTSTLLETLAETLHLFSNPSLDTREGVYEPLHVVNELGVALQLEVTPLRGAAGGELEGLGVVDDLQLEAEGEESEAPVALQVVREHLQRSAKGTAVLQTQLLSDLVRLRIVPLGQSRGSFRDTVEDLRVDRACEEVFVLAPLEEAEYEARRSSSMTEQDAAVVETAAVASGPRSERRRESVTLARQASVLEGEDAAVPFVWDVKHEVSGRVTVRIRGAVDLVNAFDFPLEVCTSGGPEVPLPSGETLAPPDVETRFLVAPKSSRGLPASFGACKVIYVRNFVDGTPGNVPRHWSEPLRLPKLAMYGAEVEAPEARPVFSIFAAAEDPDAPSFFAAVKEEIEPWGARVTISPTVYVQSLLPCAVEARIYPGVPEGRPAGGVQEATCLPAEAVPLPGLTFTRELPSLALRLGEYEWSTTVALEDDLLPDEAVRVNYITMSHPAGGGLCVYAAVQPDCDTGAVRILLWVPFWVVDKTGAELAIAHEEDDSISFPRPRRVGHGSDIVLRSVRSGSQRQAGVGIAAPGEPLFMDRPHAWRRLPERLVGAVQLRLHQEDRLFGHDGKEVLNPFAGRASMGAGESKTAEPAQETLLYKDRDRRTAALPPGALLSVVPSTEVVVYVAMDANASPFPAWLADGGYTNLEETFVEPPRPGMAAVAFAIFASPPLPAREPIILGPNAAPTAGARAMYCAFVQDARDARAYDAQDETPDETATSLAGDASPKLVSAALRQRCESVGDQWARGEHGLHLWSPPPPKKKATILKTPLPGVGRKPGSDRPVPYGSFALKELYVGLDGGAPDSRSPLSLEEAGQQNVSVRNARARLDFMARSRVAAGPFGTLGTRIVTLMPRVSVVNGAQASLRLRQVGLQDEDRDMILAPGERRTPAWAVVNADTENAMKLGMGDAWSWGGFRFDKVGTHALHLRMPPERREQAVARYAAGVESGGLDNTDLLFDHPEAVWTLGEEIVLHIDVRLAQPEEFCEFAVVVHHATLLAPGHDPLLRGFPSASRTAQPLYAVQNETPLRLQIRQAFPSKLNVLGQRGRRPTTFPEWKLEPKSAVAWGFADPLVPKLLELVTRTGVQELPPLDEVGTEMQIPVPQSSQTLLGSRVLTVRIEPQGSTKVVRIAPSTDHLVPGHRLQERVQKRRAKDGAKAPKAEDRPLTAGDVKKVDTPSDPSKTRLHVEVYLPLLAVSVIDDSRPRPHNFSKLHFRGRHGMWYDPSFRSRREILFAGFQGIDLKFTHDLRALRQDIDFRVEAIQIDNHFPSAAYPVMLSGDPSANAPPRRGDPPPPVLQLVVVKSLGTEKPHALGFERRAARDTTRRYYFRQLKKLGAAAMAADVDPTHQDAKTVAVVRLYQDLLRRKPPAAETSMVPYVSFRLLTMELQLDLQSMLDLVKVLAPAATVLSAEEATASASPPRWLGGLSSSQLTRELSRVRKQPHVRAAPGVPPPPPDPSDTGTLPADVAQALAASRSPRTYIEKLWVHPLRIQVSFLKTMKNAPADLEVDGEIEEAAGAPEGLRKGQIPGQNIVSGFGRGVTEALWSFASVRRAPIQLSTFGADQVMESTPQLLGMITEFYARQAVYQVLLVAGSLSMLGNPVELFTDVGTGVKDLVYEPINGLMLSPQDCAKGVAKGVSGFARGVVKGTFSSVSGITDGVGKNLSLLSGDQEYAREREARRNAEMARGGGAVDGAAAGGAAMANGFFKGVTGLVTKPAEGAQSGGAFGFLKGVGQGLAGVVVKPVVGVTDCVSSLVGGIAKEADTRTVVYQACPRRAIEYDPHRGTQVLRPRLRVKDVIQHMVETKRMSGSALRYLATVFLDADTVLIVTNKRIFFAPRGVLEPFKAQKMEDWPAKIEGDVVGLTYGDVSHVLYQAHPERDLAKQSSVMVQLYGPFAYGRDRLKFAIAQTPGEDLYGVFWGMRQRLTGCPRLMRELRESPAEAAARTSKYQELYAFGSAKRDGPTPSGGRDMRLIDALRKLARDMEAAPVRAAHAKAVSTTRFGDIDDYFKELDAITFGCVADIKAITPDRKVNVCLVINMSDHPVRLHAMRREAGADSRVFSGPGCRAKGGLTEMKELFSCCALVAFGDTINAFSKGYVDVTVESTAGTIRIGDALARTLALPRPGFTLSWLLKEPAKAAKSVLVIEN